MSAPFGKFPSLRTYLDWVQKEAGCKVQEGVKGTKRIFRIDSPEGRFVMIYDLPDGEGLGPTVISNLDRRLGIDSPFPKAPEPYE